MLNLDPELELTLSLMESGCLATTLEDKTSFIYKGDRRLIDSLKDTRKIKFDLECIKRKEFPSVVINFELIGEHKKLYEFQYFFGIESDEEIRLLKNLNKQDGFDVHFFDGEIVFSLGISINNAEKDMIKGILEEALT